MSSVSLLRMDSVLPLMLSSVDPSMYTWGMPLVTGCQLDFVPLITTPWDPNLSNFLPNLLTTTFMIRRLWARAVFWLVISWSHFHRKQSDWFSVISLYWFITCPKTKLHALKPLLYIYLHISMDINRSIDTHKHRPACMWCAISVVFRERGHLGTVHS